MVPAEFPFSKESLVWLYRRRLAMDGTMRVVLTPRWLVAERRDPVLAAGLGRSSTIMLLDLRRGTIRYVRSHFVVHGMPGSAPSMYGVKDDLY